MSIKESAIALKLPYIKNNYIEALKEAHLKDMNHEQFLDWILKEENTMSFSGFGDILRQIVGILKSTQYDIAQKQPPDIEYPCGLYFQEVFYFEFYRQIYS